MKFNKKITLLTLEPQSGAGDYKETARATVWADISDVGVTTKLSGLSVGQDISFSAVMWRKEHKDYTHAIYDGVMYKIVETGSAKNPLHIKLLLERG